MKTIIIGLGGLGCKAVSRIYGRIDKRKVEAFGIDVDYGDLNYIEESTGLPCFYMGPKRNLSLTDLSNNKEWFPFDFNLPYIPMHSVGGSRAFGRLFFELFFQQDYNDFLIRLERALYEPQDTIRVVIVTSLAGGFGAGALIPLSLMIRELSKTYRNEKTIITGVFISPEFFISVFPDLSLYQKDTMRANAYAVLKELNMINEICMSESPTNDLCDMKIMDLFDSDKDRGNKSKVPFDEVLFVKSPHAKGDYTASIDEVSNCLLTIVTSKLYASQKDSRLTSKLVPYWVKGDYSRIYGCVGSSCITYPHSFIVKYCCTRTIIREIVDVWTLVDRELENKKGDYSPDNGESTENEASIRNIFISTVNSMLEEGNAKLGFITKAITDISEDGRQRDRADIYYDYVYNFVLDRIKGDEEIKTKSNEAGVTEKQLKGDLVTSATRCETALKDYLDTINSRIVLLRSSIVQSIIPDDLSSAINPDSDWNIMKLVTSNGHIVHPLAMRMLLYKFRAKVSEEYERCSSATTSNIKAINDYFKKAYDIKGTEEIESATDRANQKGLFKQGKFRAEYMIKSAAQKAKLDKYRDEEVISVVFGDILKRLDSVIEGFEDFFNSLNYVVTVLQDDVKTWEKSIMNMKGSLYLSTKEIEEIYDSLDISSFEFNNSDLFEIIFNDLYIWSLHTYERNKYRFSISQSTKVKEHSYDYECNLFRKKLVPRIESNFMDEFSDKLNLDLFDAMEKVTDRDRESEERLFYSACQRAAPQIAIAPLNLSICIVNDSLYERIRMHNALSVFSNYCDIDKNDCISNKEVIILREKSGLSFADILRSAEYIKCEEVYKLTLDKYRKRPQCRYCPHIDKRWCE